ncbi:MAG: hypothetical protein ABIU58_03230 [Ramlibacter sp.]
MNHPRSTFGEAGSAVSAKEDAWRVGFKPSVVAWSLAVALVFLLAGTWLAAGEFWFAELYDQDWENGLFWLVFAFAGLYFVGVWMAAAIGRLRNGAVLAVGAEGINHFAVGPVAWSELESVRIRQRNGSGPHVLLAIFKIASSQPNLQLELSLKAPAYEEVSSRLNRMDCIALMTAISFYNARREVVLHCWAFDCDAPQLAQSLARSAAAHRVPVQDLTIEQPAPRPRKAR